MKFFRFSRKSKKTPEDHKTPSPNSSVPTIDIPGLSDASSSSMSAPRSPNTDSFISTKTAPRSNTDHPAWNDDCCHHRLVHAGNKHSISNSVGHKKDKVVSTTSAVTDRWRHSNCSRIIVPDSPAARGVPLASQTDSAIKSKSARRTFQRLNEPVPDSDLSDSEDGASDLSTVASRISSCASRSVHRDRHSASVIEAPMARMQERHRQDVRRSLQHTPTMQYMPMSPPTSARNLIVPQPSTSTFHGPIHARPLMARSASVQTRLGAPSPGPMFSPGPDPQSHGFHRGRPLIPPAPFPVDRSSRRLDPSMHIAATGYYSAYYPRPVMHGVDYMVPPPMPQPSQSTSIVDMRGRPMYPVSVSPPPIRSSGIASTSSRPNPMRFPPKEERNSIPSMYTLDGRLAPSNQPCRRWSSNSHQEWSSKPCRTPGRTGPPTWDTSYRRTQRDMIPNSRGDSTGAEKRPMGGYHPPTAYPFHQPSVQYQFTRPAVWI